MGSQAIKAADQSRAQWYWKSNSDPWSTNENEEWTKYSDIESAIIEEAFNGQNKTKLAELQNYSINLNDSIQISKSDPNKQRQIKRVLISTNESQGLREERFFLTPALSKTFNDDYGKEAYIFLSQWQKDNELSDAEIVEQAANGIIIEGQQLEHAGLDISQLSYYDEEEVLLPPATEFTIMEVQKTTTKTCVYLKLLPNTNTRPTPNLLS
ncbi:unnamed protein product [Didymodactylos carnosus]|uniref:WWE domain-containing protein n=1 Tax=Didymodactylos carnosus TaxID=1234261 RepID=A0A8S2D100_9BILA|nr:unnamed protein product [Didymodactylos carnosus]CAF3569531.1 unnamed protein product [Didymodactylos carnosus]